MNHMLVLQQLVQCQSLDAGDKLYFVFKNFNFQCRVSALGILFDCSFSTQACNREACFLDRGGFSGLTDWADCCLQDLACEYVTRFSSWKRIRHVKTNRLLSEIRDLQREKKMTAECPIYLHLQKQLLLYQQQLQEIRNRMLSWQQWLAKQADSPKDLQLFMKTAFEFSNGDLYVFADLATMRQLACSVPGTSAKRKRRSVKRVLKVAENPIEELICSDDVNDDEYQEMLKEFFKNVSTIKAIK